MLPFTSADSLESRVNINKDSKTKQPDHHQILNYKKDKQ